MKEHAHPIITSDPHTIAMMIIARILMSVGSAPPDGGIGALGTSVSLPGKSGPPDGVIEAVGTSVSLPGKSGPPDGVIEAVDVSVSLPEKGALPDGAADAVDVSVTESGKGVAVSSWGYKQSSSKAAWKQFPAIDIKGALGWQLEKPHNTR